jgi:hypothetical protein
MSKRLVYICDWLPPDFGAVGQYAVLFARQWASEGWAAPAAGDIPGLSHALRRLIEDEALRRRQGRASLARIQEWGYRECLEGVRAAVADLIYIVKFHAAPKPTAALPRRAGRFGRTDRRGMPRTCVLIDARPGGRRSRFYRLAFVRTIA